MPENENYLKNTPLGEPLPNSIHAASVSLPKWQDVVDYEEAKPRVLNALKAGYPRFVYHPLVKKLFAKCESEFAGKGEFCIAMPSKKAADKCLSYVEEKCGVAGKAHLVSENVYAVCFSEKGRNSAKEFWQHSGYIVSSRKADSILKSSPLKSAEKEKDIIRKRISELSGQDDGDIFLFPSGMLGILSAFEALKEINPGAKTIQLGFPYVDTLKVQQKFGDGVYFLPYNNEKDLQAVEKIINEEKIAGVFCEFPGNPLLQSIELEKLSNILRKKHVPLVIDDTVATWANVDLSDYADITVTSLTKFFSGEGDVLAGTVIVNKKSPFHDRIKNEIYKDYEDLLFSEDAIVLEGNSKNFIQKINNINKTTEIICNFLSQNNKIERVFYPKFITAGTYGKYKKSSGGYGGLFSITFKNPADAPIFYDKLELAKGPGLGTSFTLVCPYTVIAHYNEIDMAEKFGVKKNLIRVSVGLENPEDLIKTFAAALS